MELTADEIRTQFGARKNAGRSMIVLTKMGYLMLVKSFTDDLAWMIQRQLVKSYFEAQNVLLGTAAVEQIPAYSSAGSLSTIFLRAIQQAIDSGEYYLRPRYKHMGKSTPRSGSIFGVYDRHDVYLLSRLAYDIYVAVASDPVSIQNLWPMLERSGTILPRKEVGRVCIVQGKDLNVVGLGRDKLRVPCV